SGGAGIEVTGAATTPSIAIGAGYQLPQNCGNGEIPKSNGSGWSCASDNGASYSAGQGLNLNGTTFSLANGGVQNGNLASGAVAFGNISATGSSAGQTLVSNGTSVSWQTLAGSGGGTPPSSLASFDALNGLACNLGSPNAGRIQI